MPHIGDTKIDRDYASIRFIWLPCTHCGKERWIGLNSTKIVGWAGLCAPCYRSIYTTSMEAALAPYRVKAREYLKHSQENEGGDKA